MVDMWRTMEFTITEEHLKLSRRMYVSWFDCEFGAPCIDPKRPYGNSYVEGDMLEILGIKDPRDPNEYEDLPEDLEQRLNDIHKEMQLVLQIWLSAGVIQAGTFIRDSQYSNGWRLKE